MQMKNTVNQETTLPIYSALGHRFEVSNSIIRFSISHPRFLIFLGSVVAILILFDAHHYRQMLGIGQTALVWTVSVTLVVLFYLAAIYTLLGLKKYMQGLVVYMPLVGAASITASSFLTIKFAYFLAHDGVPDGIFLAHLPFNIVAVVIFEVLFFVFVAPMLRQNQFETFFKTSPSSRRITISGDEIHSSDIVYMQAQDHYVSVVLLDRHLLPRARLRDLARQLPASAGGLVHRSYWVSWQYITAYEKTAHNQTLTLSCGARIPVAKSRKADVERSLHLYSQDSPLIQTEI